MESKSGSESAGRLKKIFMGVLFALVLLIPRMLSLRRNPHAWLALRILLGAAGAALVLVPLSLRENWLWSVFGVLLFAAAVLFPAARHVPSVDDKAREVGALVVVNGGEYRAEGGEAVAVQLFAGADRIWALDCHLAPVLIIPAAEIRSLRTTRVKEESRLQIEWGEHSAEFIYRGFFAEHLAEVAESTLRSVLRSPLPVIQEKPQSRAAGA